MSRHRKRTLRLRTALLEELRQAAAAGIDIARKEAVQAFHGAESERFLELYARMQDPAVQEATARALRGTPEEMGRAAVKAARRDAAARQRSTRTL